MAEPILDTNATFAHGTYPTFKLHSNGRFTGHILPAGQAFLVNPSTTVDIHQHFLAARGRNVRGTCSGFIMATSTTPFSELPVSTDFDCDLALVMGVTSTDTDKVPAKVDVYYYLWKGDLGNHKSVTDAMIKLNNPHKFCKAMFSTTLHHSQLGQRHFMPLNQISGYTFPSFHYQFVHAPRDDKLYHEMRPGPDQWLIGYLHKEQEKKVKFVRPANVSNIDMFEREQLDDDVSKACNTKYIQQFPGLTCVIYCTRTHESLIDGEENYIQQVLPECPDGYTDFAMLLPKQKRKLEKKMKKKGDGWTTNGSDFREKMEYMSEKNCGHKYIRRRNITIGSTHENGHVINNYIISMVTREDMEYLLKNEDNVVRTSDNECRHYIQKNVQDPYIYGVVVYRCYPFPKEVGYDKRIVNVMQHFSPKEGLQRGDAIPHRGNFNMHGTRQTRQSSGSAGEVSEQTNHQYFDKAQHNQSLSPFVGSIINTLSSAATTTQDSSGQVCIGTIKAAVNDKYGGDIKSRDVCQSQISTLPRWMPSLQHNTSFDNVLHHDGNDITDKEVGKLVVEHLNTCNCPILVEYYKRIHELFDDKIDRDRIPLPTTCAWEQIDIPEDFGFVHKQFFILAETGHCFDLSSAVFHNNANDFSGLACTFQGYLAGHLTSSSLWLDPHDGVTILMPGRAGLKAWGSSGGYAYLRSTGTARQNLIVNLINTHRTNHGGAVPRRLPGVDIRSFLVQTRRGTVINVRAPTNGGSNGNTGRGRGVVRSRSRSRSRCNNRSRRTRARVS